MKADLIGEPYRNLARRPGVLLMPARLENDGLMRLRHLARRHARLQAQRRDQLS